MAKSPVEQEGGRDLFSKGLQSTYYELLALLDFRGLSHSYLRQSSKQERRDAKEGFSSRVRAMKL